MPHVVHDATAPRLGPGDFLRGRACLLGLGLGLGLGSGLGLGLGSGLGLGLGLGSGLELALGRRTHRLAQWTRRQAEHLGVRS